MQARPSLFTLAAWAASFAAAVVFTSCGGRAPQASSPLVPSNAPAWVNRGGGAFNDGGRSFYGVGVVAGIRNPALARSSADARARTEITQSLHTYITALMRDFQASTGNIQSSEDQQMVDQTIRVFTDQDLSGARVIDHWQDPQSGTLYALAKLDFEQAQEAFAKMTQLNAQARDYIRANAEQAFDRLEQARQQQRQSP